MSLAHDRRASFHSAAAYSDASGDGNELPIGATGKHVMEAALYKQPGRTGLEVESGAGIKPELCRSTGGDRPDIVGPGGLEVVNAGAADEVRTHLTLFQIGRASCRERLWDSVSFGA